MITINFPAIQKSVVTTKDDVGSPFNFITVKSGVAVILGVQSIFCFDIRGYFAGSQLIKEDQKEEFEKLMQFLEGKNLRVEFWEKLVGKHDITVMNDDCIKLESDKVNFDLYYEDCPDFKVNDFDSYMTMLKSTYRLPNVVAYAHSPRPDVMKKFLDGFGSLIKKSQMVFKNKANASYHVFTVDNMPFIFGLVSSDPGIIDKSFQFDTFSNFVSKI